MNVDEMITTIDYIRDLAPDAEGWAQEQIANDLDQRDAEIKRLKAKLAETESQLREMSRLVIRTTELEAAPRREGE